MKTVAVKPATKTLEVKPLTSDLAIIKRDPGLVEASAALPSLRKKIDALKVIDQASSEQMTDLVGECIRAGKKAEELRKRFVDPLNQHVKFINSMFKTVTGPLEEAENAGRAKLNTFLREEKRKADELAAKQAQAYERKVERTEARGGSAAEVAPPPEIEYQAGVQTETTAAATRMVPKFQLAGKLTEVDPEYLVLDEMKVRRVLKAGIREIRGLKIWEEPEASIYT